MHSGFNNRFLLCHPLIHHFVNLSRDGIEPGQWVETRKDAGFVLDGYGVFKRSQLEYYYRKYLFLEENGYFDEVDVKQKLSDRLTAQSVKTSLANCHQLTFEVTDSCNLDCEYCAYGKFYCDYDRREGKNLAVDVAAKMLDYLLELWNSPLNHSHRKPVYISFYGGEPLLNFEFIKKIVGYIRTLKMEHNRIKFSMTTNGLLLHKYMDFLVEHDFHLLVSLDGNETHNSYRVMKGGKSSHPVIISNLKRLRRHYPDFFSANVRFNAVLHNRNSISAIVKYFREEFKKSPNISEVNPHGLDSGKKEEFLNTYRNMSESLNQEEEYFEDQKKKAFSLPKPRDVIESIRRYSGATFRKYDELLASGKNRRFIPTGTCIPFSRMVFITVNGKILPCERIGHQFSLGGVTPLEVKLDFQHIAETYNAYYDRLARQCHACYNTEACIQCLFNLTIGDAHPKCFGFKNYKDISGYFAGVLTYMEKHPEVYFNVMEEMYFG